MCVCECECVCVFVLRVCAYVRVLRVPCRQIGHSGVIAACFFGSMITVAFFNFFGVTITKYVHVCMNEAIWRLFTRAHLLCVTQSGFGNSVGSHFIV